MTLFITLHRSENQCERQEPIARRTRITDNVYNGRTNKECCIKYGGLNVDTTSLGKILLKKDER